MSKNEVFRSKYARQVVAAGRGHVEEIITGIQTLHGPDAIDPAHTRAEILGKCDLLASVTDAHVIIAQALGQDLAEDIQVREMRDLLGVNLNDVLVAIRGAMRDNFGAEVLRIYRLDERIPTSHEGLAGYAADVAVRLEQNPRSTNNVLGHLVTTTDLAVPLTQIFTGYRTALENVAREARETELARVRRDQSDARFQRVLDSVAGIIAGYLRLAGLDALAERIRPTRARTTGAVDPELPDSESPDPDLSDPGLPATEPPADPVQG